MMLYDIVSDSWKEMELFGADSVDGQVNIASVKDCRKVLRTVVS